MSNIVLTAPPVLELATLCAAGTLSAPPAKVYCSQIVIGRLRVLVRKPAIPNQATRTSRGRPKPSRKAITQVPHVPPKASPRTGIAPWTSNRCSAATLTGITNHTPITKPILAVILKLGKSTNASARFLWNRNTKSFREVGSYMTPRLNTSPCCPTVAS